MCLNTVVVGTIIEKRDESCVRCLVAVVYLSVHSQMQTISAAPSTDTLNKLKPHRKTYICATERKNLNNTDVYKYTCVYINISEKSSWFVLC